ncbi:DUF2254 domain-containing protein [Angustibacter sp. McL0619]|uniref:DUF2254 domain-containing protein n=1 Tax=Angustibacter sp. McL0619 TaxID=3415676 RepID=UPI003CEC37EB
MRQTGTRDYLKGALWVYPTVAAVLALAAGSVLSSIDVPPGSWLEPLLFQGTADDARSLLIGISGTMMTVIALVLGLTLVALQLSSTQFSPRILRNFLQDRVNQVVLSVFVATFVYSTAGLYTVGINSGRRTDEYPQLAVTLAIALMFASLIVLVYFVHHISHSIQVDQVMVTIENRTMLAIEHDLPTKDVYTEGIPLPPAWAVPVRAYRSGYVQTLHPSSLVRAASAAGVVVSVVPMVGEHVLADEPLAWLWRPTADDPTPDPAAVAGAVQDAVRIGFERTAEQDVAFGIRQLADVAVKALSPAVNDPYTGIQALEHISVVLTALASRSLGSQLVPDDSGALRVVLRGRDLEYLVELATGQIRRYGRDEPRVLQALLRTLRRTGYFCRDDEGRAVVARHVRLVIEAARTNVGQQGDLAPVIEHGEAVLRDLTR